MPHLPGTRELASETRYRSMDALGRGGEQVEIGVAVVVEEQRSSKNIWRRKFPRCVTWCGHPTGTILSTRPITGILVARAERSHLNLRLDTLIPDPRSIGLREEGNAPGVTLRLPGWVGCWRLALAEALWIRCAERSQMAVLVLFCLG